MKNFTCCLSPGHTPTQPGAAHGNVTEYGLSSAIIGDMIFRLSKLGHTAHMIGSESNVIQAAIINRICPDFGLELHFNSNTVANINGSMCLHYPGSLNGYSLSVAIQHELTKMLGTKDSGIHYAHYELNPDKPIITIVRDTNCPFIVVEPLYFSNVDDFEKIDIPSISIAIVEGCVNYWSEVTA